MLLDGQDMGHVFVTMFIIHVNAWIKGTFSISMASAESQTTIMFQECKADM
jgi:hypothetical protein